jgi:putative FmdB family regulatory protein
MPTYDYLCKACGREFSAMQSMSEPPLDLCEFDDCRVSGQVERLLGGGAGLIFKGSGFYITDYKGEKGARTAPAKSATGAGGESGSGETAAAAGGGESAGGVKQEGTASGGAAPDKPASPAPGGADSKGSGPTK